MQREDALYAFMRKHFLTSHVFLMIFLLFFSFSGFIL